MFLADRFVTSIFAFSGFGPPFPRVTPDSLSATADECFQALNYEREATFRNRKQRDSTAIQRETTGKNNACKRS